MTSCGFHIQRTSYIFHIFRWHFRFLLTHCSYFMSPSTVPHCGRARFCVFGCLVIAPKQHVLIHKLHDFGLNRTIYDGRSVAPIIAIYGFLFISETCMPLVHELLVAFIILSSSSDCFWRSFLVILYAQRKSQFNDDVGWRHFFSKCVSRRWNQNALIFFLIQIRYLFFPLIT